MRALIAGCGDLGTELGLRLARRAVEVHGLRRRPELLPEPLHGVAGDLAADDGLAGAPGGLDLAVHVATAGSRDPERYRAVYDEGLRRLIDHATATAAADRQRPPRVLLVSSTTVHGDAGGDWVDEDTPRAPDTATGEVVAAAEQRLVDAHRAGAVEGVVLRLAGIYGPGRTFLIDRVRAGEAVRPDPPQHANRIHRDDAAAAAERLLLRDEAAPPTGAGLPATPDPIYLGVDLAPVDRGEVIAFLAERLGVPTPPRGPASSRGGDKRCRSDRLRATGWEPAYPTYREGYAAVLAGEGVRHP